MASASARTAFFLLAGLLLWHRPLHGASGFELSLRPGIAIPVGQFVSKNYPSGGYALAGQDYSAAGRAFILPRFGIVCAGSIALFPFDAGQYAFDTRGTLDPALESISISADPYLINTLTAGILYRYPLNGSWALTGSLSAGWIGAETAWQHVRTYYFMVGERDYEVTSAFDESRIWQAEAELSRRLFEHGGVSLIAGFNRADLQFDFMAKSGAYTRNLAMSWTSFRLGVNFMMQVKRTHMKISKE